MTALSKIRVLDFGRYVAGPYCATLLADFGADVIRVDRRGGSEDRTIAPVTDEGEGALFLQINRNKRSITFDPSAHGAAELHRRLIESADVVVVNVPDAALQKMGLDYATLSAIKPGIILANVSSFGPTGPWARRPGFDSVGQAMCGSAFLSGPGDQPYRTPITWVDHASAVYTAFGVMTALFERGVTGRGQQVDCSLLGSALAYSSTFLIEEAALGIGRGAIGNRSFLNGPTDTFRVNDGWIVTQVVGQPLFKRWCTLMQERDWLDDPRFATDDLRGENGAVLSERMARWCAGKTVDEALDLLAQANIPAGPVLSPRGALTHPQVQAMGILQETELRGNSRALPLTLPPVILRDNPVAIRRAPPGVGEHTDEVLRELLFSDRDIVGLRETGVV